jgi:hypothetical protein
MHSVALKRFTSPRIAAKFLPRPRREFFDFSGEVLSVAALVLLRVKASPARDFF